MHSRVRGLTVGLLLVFACKSDDSGDTGVTTDHDHDDDHGAEASAGTSSATTPGTSSGGDHDHVAETTADSDHGASSSSGDHGGDDHSVDTDGSDPIVAYCGCMLANCHDEYHAKWGEDHVASEEACMMEAEALPQNGSPIEAGNFFECREHFCEAAAGDPSVCANAIGAAVCI